jgi:hypothetical protein
LTRYKEEEEEKNYYQGASVCSIDIYKKEEKKISPKTRRKKIVTYIENQTNKYFSIKVYNNFVCLVNY